MAYISIQKQVHEHTIKKTTFWYAVASLVLFFILAPAIIYFFHLISSINSRFFGALILTIAISYAIYKVLLTFFHGFDADNNVLDSDFSME